MMKELIEDLFEEKDGFYKYIALAQKSSDPMHRQMFTKMAEEEMGHYKDIYGFIFKDKNHEHMSDIEKSFHKMATKVCDDMKSALMEAKTIK